MGIPRAAAGFEDPPPPPPRPPPAALSATICQVEPAGIAPSGAPVPSSVTNSSPSPPTTTCETPANSPTRSSGSAPGVRGAGGGQAVVRSATLASAGVAQRRIQVFEREGNVGIRMGAGDKGGLEGRGGEKHAACQGSAVPAPEQGDIGRRAHGPPRRAAPRDLAGRGKAGAPAETPRGPAGGDAEAGHPLTEDQQRPVGATQPPQGGMELRFGRDEAHVAEIRLDDDG